LAELGFDPRFASCEARGVVGAPLIVGVEPGVLLFHESGSAARFAFVRVISASPLINFSSRLRTLRDLDQATEDPVRRTAVPRITRSPLIGLDRSCLLV
jgi:hypothetical protein